MFKGNREVQIISYKQILCQVKAINGNLVIDKLNYRNGVLRSNTSFINIFCVHWKYETHYFIFYAKFESTHTVNLALGVLARMCPCTDSYEPSLPERNIRLPKIGFFFLFFSVRFISAPISISF